MNFGRLRLNFGTRRPYLVKKPSSSPSGSVLVNERRSARRRPFAEEGRRRVLLSPSSFWSIGAFSVHEFGWYMAKFKRAGNLVSDQQEKQKISGAGSASEERYFGP